LAASQHGVVSRAQLRASGIGRRAIDGRLARGALHAVHRGVYTVGDPLVSTSGRWLGAVLAVGDGAVLSHRSAAALWDLLPAGGALDVTAPRILRSRPGLIVHYAVLPEDEVAAERGIPVTTVARTLLDLAAVAKPRWLERAVREAEVRRLGDRPSLDELLARYPHRRGIVAVRTILAERRLGLGVTRSALEDRFLMLIRQAGLAMPELNAALDLRDRWIEVDCLWRDQRLIVELDGRAVHGTSFAFDADRERDRALQAMDWTVIRITWRQLVRHPARVEADLRTLLGG